MKVLVLSFYFQPELCAGSFRNTAFVKGLKKRNYTKGGDDETIFLEPLNIILDSGKSPAETWKNLFLGEWNNNVDMIYETNYFKV